LIDVDEKVYKNLIWILENDINGMGFDFTYTVSIFGHCKDFELIENGS
jgi:hypothetical protein